MRTSDQPRVLLVSWSPVPTPKYQKIEGSGQRFFGLANGLIANGVADVTIAVGSIYPLDVDEVSGIKLINYDFNDAFAEKLAGYDTVILNYAIHGAAFVIEHLPATTQVIFDAYGPAYIESLARDPEDLVGTYVGNLSAVRDVFNKILPRGDYFLYANDAQEKFYTGVLASLGVINQFSYKTKRLINTPFGIDKPDRRVHYDNPYQEHGIVEADFTLLWFGGLYPWFDITGLLKAVGNLRSSNVKLVIIGGNNPQNQHPDFVKRYNDVIAYVKKNDLSDRIVFIDWVDYATRRKYYEYADAIISINNEGKENHYSWRTRVMDYLGSTTPLITNGGDPLSDELVRAGAAFAVDHDDPKAIERVIGDLSRNKELLSVASEHMRAIQPKYYWTTVTKEIADLVANQEKPYGDERVFRMANGLDDTLRVPSAGIAARLRQKAARARSLAGKVRRKGLKTALVIGGDKARRKADRTLQKFFPVPKPTEPRIVFVSNQFNNTGAPFVLMDLIETLVREGRAVAKKTSLVTFTPIDVENVRRMRRLGIDVNVYTNRELPITFNKDDVVFFNTFAVSRTTIFSAINSLQAGILHKIYWYGHEASPEGFVDQDVKDIFRNLLKEDKAEILAVSERTTKDYAAFFGTDRNVGRMPYRFLFEEDKFKALEPKDFAVLKFVATGSLMDMRKGHYPILYALLDFYHNKYLPNPDAYRDFHITFVGAYDAADLHEHAPYHIRNILAQFETSSRLLGNRVSILPTLSHRAALDEIASSNVTICYSLKEALPIFVYEGMASGHPVIRNEVAGSEEQLKNGVNGIGVSTDDFSSLTDAFETLLNRKKTSDDDLVSMSKESLAIAQAATKNEYSIIRKLTDTIK